MFANNVSQLLARLKGGVWVRLGDGSSGAIIYEEGEIPFRVNPYSVCVRKVDVPEKMKTLFKAYSPDWTDEWYCYPSEQFDKLVKNIKIRK